MTAASMDSDLPFRMNSPKLKLWELLVISGMFGMTLAAWLWLLWS